MGERVGKKRATIANYLRLLNLPVEVQNAIREKKISMGHARALLGIEDKELQIEVFTKILAQDLSVRQVENLARGSKVPVPEEEEPASKKKRSDYEDLTRTLVSPFRSKCGV